MICIGSSVVCFIHDQVVESIVLEVLQMERYALDATADHMTSGLFDRITIAAHRDRGPQLPESFGCLVHQLLRMSDE